jgi:hypothetical protein
MGCAAAMKIVPVPCGDTVPEVRAGPKEVLPTPRKFFFTNVGRRNVTVYGLVEPTGLVNPDSIMVCGLDESLAKKNAAEAMAKSVFRPGTKDGIPVRKWFAFVYKPGQR